MVHSFCTCHVEAIFVSASSQSDINTFFSHELKKENRNISEVFQPSFAKIILLNDGMVTVIIIVKFR